MPSLDNRTISSALSIDESRNTALGRSIAPLVDDDPGKSGVYPMKRLSDAPERNKSAGSFGSSASSLHAKTFAIDGERAFIGSFQLRSTLDASEYRIGLRD